MADIEQCEEKVLNYQHTNSINLGLEMRRDNKRCGLEMEMKKRGRVSILRNAEK
jgi:hypothetical protein